MTVATNWLLAANAAGVRMAVRLAAEYVTVPGTAAPCVVLTSVKLRIEMLAGFMASLKVAVIAVLVGTKVAPGAGTVSTTVGRVVSGGGAVMKLQTKALANAKPVVSCTAVERVAVHEVLAGSGAVGVSVATWVVAL